MHLLHKKQNVYLPACKLPIRPLFVYVKNAVCRNGIRELPKTVKNFMNIVVIKFE